MEYVYAAMLLHKAGKPINEENVTKILTAAGINADPIRVKALVASVAEVNIDEAIRSTAFTPTVAAPTEAPSGPAKEKPPEKEKEEEKKEEAALEGLGALFG